ncbi:4-hydroxyphenylacetate 3-hydroxylase family protein [Paenibacillus hodogayensis]|uniref:4-hydroxyphenylacetate 3-hydroxylase family protein n=1 Tax=Paenibacillus hodogayensis TaxID=279208 RepID=A0ABV5VRE5_9BACL
MSEASNYLQRLQDGRNVWVNGERVADLTTHPVFSGTVKTVARTVALQDDPEVGGELTFETDTGVRSHNAFLVPERVEDIARRSRAFEIWTDASFGTMSRLGGSYRSQVTGLYINRAFAVPDQPHYAERMERYYRDVRDRNLLVTSAGHDPQIDRTKLASQLGDLYTAVRIVRETEEGIVLRGAKMIATGAPYMDEIIVSPLKPIPASEKDYALMFFVAVGTPGVHLLCRESFASENEEDHPLSSRYDEMDAVVIFDDALIPWERVLVKNDPDLLWKVRSQSIVGNLSVHENIVRSVNRLEFVAAVGNELADSIGIKKFAHVQDKLAELFYQIEAIKALLLVSERNPVRHPAGVWLANGKPLTTAKNLMNRFYPRAVEILQLLSASGVLQAPSTMADFRGPLGPRLEEYFRGADRSAQERIQLLKLNWELTGSKLGARHVLYERYYGGDPERTHARQYEEYDKQPLLDKVKARLAAGGFR